MTADCCGRIHKSQGLLCIVLLFSTLLAALFVGVVVLISYNNHVNSANQTLQHEFFAG